MEKGLTMADTATEVLAKLQRQEAKEVSGAPSRTPKQMMLDASEAKEQNPDKHLRWVSLKDTNKLTSRKAEGYVAIDEEKGGKALGDELVLMGMPKELYEQRLARQKEEAARRISQHNKDWENLAEATARELRDKHGLKVDAKNLMRT